MHLRNKSQKRQGARRGLAMVVAMVVGLLSLLASPLMATAAELTASVSNMRITEGYDPTGEGTPVDQNSQITTDTQLTFHADWSIATEAKDGDTFAIPLPETFRIASSQEFALNDDNGKRVATCQYTLGEADLACKIVGGPYTNVDGNIWFSGKLTGNQDGSNPKWEVGNQVVVLPAPSEPTVGPYQPTFDTTKVQRGGVIENGHALLSWGLYFWPGCSEGEGDVTATCHDSFTVQDTLTTTDETQPHTIVPGSFELIRYDRVKNADGSWATGDNGNPVGDLDSRVVIAHYVDGVWTRLADADAEVFQEPAVAADGKSFTFSLSNVEVPHGYRLTYQTVADGAASIEGDKFTNTATINGGPVIEATNTAHVQGGGGASFGDYTSFKVSKKLTNNSGQTLPEAFAITIAQGEQLETVAVPADGTAVNSPRFPANGGTITICEALPEVNGVDWDAYTITGEGVTGPNADGCYTVEPVGGQQIALVVENVAKPVESPEPVKPSIKIVKKDENGNDADEAADAADLTELKGAVGLVFTITNDGTEDLKDIKVTDVITTGDAKVENLSCTFEDETTGTTWAGPFKVGDSFECTADLSGVKAGDPHANNATVTGVGVVSGKDVKDENPYNAKVVEETTPPATDEPTTPAPTTEAPAPSDEPTPPAAEQPKDNLANTGANSIGAAVIGALLLVAGGLLVAQRRRTAAAEHSE